MLSLALVQSGAALFRRENFPATTYCTYSVFYFPTRTWHGGLHRDPCLRPTVRLRGERGRLPHDREHLFRTGNGECDVRCDRG
jgi:hypothetical protein